MFEYALLYSLFSIIFSALTPGFYNLIVTIKLPKGVTFCSVMAICSLFASIGFALAAVNELGQAIDAHQIVIEQIEQPN